MRGLPVLGVMTTGGDCPGLNAALAALGKMAPAFGYDLLAIRGGTAGLLTSPPDVFPLTPDTLDETIISQGGSILGSINADGPKPATTKESLTLQNRIKNAVHDLGLSGLIIIGGDGSFRIAHELHQNTKIPIIGIPKTIDRDVGGTHYTLGFDSAVAENVRALSILRATANSHHRLIIAEIMGRSHGHLALASGLSAMVDAILIPECHPDVDRLCAQLENKHHQKSLIVVLAEGLQTLRGLPGGRLIETLADTLQTRLNRPTRSMVIGYLQRGAPPTSFERLMASRMAHAALSLAKAGEKQAVVTVDNHGNMGSMTLDALTTAPVFFNQDHLMLAESLGIGLGRAPSPLVGEGVPTTPFSPMIQTQNPTTGVVEKTFSPLTSAQLGAAVEKADQAQRSHKKTTLTERATVLVRAATLLLDNKEKYAALITREMGKPLAQSRAEVEKCAAVCQYYADAGEGLLHPRAEKNAVIRYDPLGLILAVMPWNFPFWQVVRCAAPVLMAGNGFLLKHASNVPECALAIQDVFEAAGFVPVLFQTLLIEKEAVPGLLSDDRIRGATLTGSEAAGASLASLAGAALKPTVLELGGSDPLIIMPTADLDVAAEMAVRARMLNTGQSCIAAKRFVIHTDVYDTVVERIMGHVEALTLGDPLDPATDLGPLATEGIRHSLSQDVAATLAAGAHSLRRGGPVEAPGFFYAPTVLSDIPPDSPAARKELFGPVISLYRVRNSEEALHVANGTPYGLGASVWTQDPGEKTFFVENLEAGSITVNGMVRSDPALPFGGVKASGYGRELGAEGIRSFTNMKTVRGLS